MSGLVGKKRNYQREGGGSATENFSPLYSMCSVSGLKKDYGLVCVRGAWAAKKEPDLTFGGAVFRLLGGQESIGCLLASNGKSQNKLQALANKVD